VFVLAAGAASLALLGPGSWSLDNALGLTWSGRGWFLFTVLSGVGSAVALLACFYRPKADEVPPS
jgi:putative oxidoreductase